MSGIFDPGIFDSGIFDTPSGGSSVSRTASDSVTTSDSAARVITAARSVTDAPTTSEAATRLAVLSRTDADAVTTSDSATASTGSFPSRSTSDSVTTSDAATRSQVLVRATTDAPTTSDVATHTEGEIRSTSDSVTTSDAVTRGVGGHRTATDAVSTADSASEVRNVRRTASDAISTTDAATRSAGTFHRTATDHPILSDLALSLPTPYAPGPVIYINGANVIKPDGDPVMFTTARFMSAVNGVAGTCSFRARDDLGTAVYVPGALIELIVDGNRVWTGFITSVKRVYAFPALNVSEFGPTRFFDIEGADLNVLFTKRIAFNQSTPENVLAPLYGHFEPDVTAISDLIADWLDLTGDAIDTSSGVTHVGYINEDQDARAWSGSDTWGEAMQSIGALPASIFYIRPNRQLAYVDDDTPDAPFGLSDVPNGTTTKGYREMEILLDGSNLANDVMCWGIGYGPKVFKRDEDATSLSDHGRWQLGEVTFGVYKQATIDRIADSIINGSPEHHRGAKDDREAVTVVTYEGGLLPAQKVPFESQVFGYSKTLPIRKMEVTFPTPTTPRYELTMSRDIDTPWSFFDPFNLNFPGFRLPKIKPPTIGLPPPGGCPQLCEQPVWDDPEYDLTHPYVPGSLSVTISGSPVVAFEDAPEAGQFSISTSGDQSAGMVACYTVVNAFDSFFRTLPSTWGTTSSNLGTWDQQGPGSGTISVSRPFGKIDQIDLGTVPNDHGDIYVRTTEHPEVWGGDFNLTAIFYSVTYPSTLHTGTLAQWALALSIDPNSLSFDQGVFFAKRDHLNGDVDTMSLITPSGTTTVSVALTQGVVRQFRWVKSGTSHKVRIWNFGSAEPSTWDIDTTGSAISAGALFAFQSQPFTRVFITDPSSTLQVWWEDIVIDYTGKPCYQDCSGTTVFDDFERTETGQWGTSTYGAPWNENFSPNPPGAVSVSGGMGNIDLSNFAFSPYFRSIQTDAMAISPLDGGFELRASFQFDTTFVGDESLIVGFTAINSANDPADSVFAYVEMSANPFHTFLSAGNAPDGITISSAPAAGTTINFAWSVSSGSWKSKVWWSGPEPGWMVTSSGPTHPWDILRVTADGSDYDPNFWGGRVSIAEIDFVGCIDVQPASALPLSGPIIENATRIDATHYQVSRAILPLSSHVWLDGFIVAYTTDYTENTAAQGILEFTSAVGAGVTVTVNYTANGYVTP